MLTGDALGKLLRDVFHAEDVAGSLVVSTCNRVEIYADVDKFHGGVRRSASCWRGTPASRSPSSPRTCTCTTRTAPSSTCCRWPAGSTRWWSARARYSARCARPSACPGAGHARPDPVRAGRARAARGQARARRDRHRPGGREPGQRRADRRGPAAAAGGRGGRRAEPGRPVGAGRRGRLDELAGRRHRGPDGRGRHRGRQPHGHAGRAAGRDRLRRHGRPLPAARRDRRGRPGRLLHRRARPRDHRGRRARGAAAPRASPAAGPARPGAAAGRRPGRRRSCPA